MNGNLTIAVELVGCARPTCGNQIALLPTQRQRLEETEERFYCPAGHGAVFTHGTPENRRLKAALAAEEQQRREAEARAARMEEVALKTQRELNEARRTLRRTATVGAHAVKTANSAHAQRRPKRKTKKPRTGA